MTAESIMLLTLKASVALTVFGIGLSVDAHDARPLFHEPTRLLKSIGAMMIIMPVVAVLLVLVVDLKPAVKIALVALSVSPVPPIWPNRVRKAGGNESYTIGLLVTTSLLAIVTIPLSMQLIDPLFAAPLAMPPRSVAMLALTTVPIPLGVGIAGRWVSPRIANRSAKHVVMAGTLVLVLGLVPILVRSSAAIVNVIGDGSLLAMAAFVVVGLAVGHVLGGPAPDDRTVLALATSTRHPAIAIAVAHANFPSQRLAAAAIVLYLLVSVALTTPYVRWAKSRRPRGAAAHPPAVAR